MSDTQMINRSEMKSGSNVKGNDFSKSQKKVYPTKFIFIGIGQCGASLAVATKKKMGETARVIAINSSYRDLDVLPEDLVPNEFRIKYGTTDGTGKNRELSQSMFTSHRATGDGGTELDIVGHVLYNYKEFLFSSTDNVKIIVMFSSAGGSGSGAGPYFTTKLTQVIQQMKTVDLRGREVIITDANRPDVIGICVTPSYVNDSEGIKSLQNTVECGSEIQKFVSKRLATFGIVTNEIPNATMTKPQMLKYVNDNVSDALVRFLGIYGKSEYKCIDSQDKRSALQTPGVFALFTIDANENPVGFQFMLPRRQRVRQLVAELPQKYANTDGGADIAMDKILSKLDIVTDDRNIGYYGDESESSLTEIVDTGLASKPIIGLFGCTEIGTLFEVFKQKLEHLMRASEEKSELMTAAPGGFDKVKETKQQVRSEYSRQIVDVDDIESMLD